MLKAFALQKLPIYFFFQQKKKKKKKSSIFTYNAFENLTSYSLTMLLVLNKWVLAALLLCIHRIAKTACVQIFEMDGWITCDFTSF